MEDCPNYVFFFMPNMRIRSTAQHTLACNSARLVLLRVVGYGHSEHQLNSEIPRTPPATDMPDCGFFPSGMHEQVTASTILQQQFDLKFSVVESYYVHSCRVRSTVAFVDDEERTSQRPSVVYKYRCSLQENHGNISNRSSSPYRSTKDKLQICYLPIRK